MYAIQLLVFKQIQMQRNWFQIFSLFGALVETLGVTVIIVASNMPKRQSLFASSSVIIMPTALKIYMTIGCFASHGHMWHLVQRNGWCRSWCRMSLLRLGTCWLISKKYCQLTTHQYIPAIFPFDTLCTWFGKSVGEHEISPACTVIQRNWRLPSVFSSRWGCIRDTLKHERRTLKQECQLSEGKRARCM